MIHETSNGFGKNLHALCGQDSVIWHLLVKGSNLLGTSGDIQSKIIKVALLVLMSVNLCYLGSCVTSASARNGQSDQVTAALKKNDRSTHSMAVGLSAPNCLLCRSAVSPHCLLVLPLFVVLTLLAPGIKLGRARTLNTISRLSVLYRALYSHTEVLSVVLLARGTVKKLGGLSSPPGYTISLVV